jgi:hypothetical protein
VSRKRAFLTPAVTTTSITIVGAPTFPFLSATKSRHEQQCSGETERSLDCATRRARIRRGGGNRVAPLGMT